MGELGECGGNFTFPLGIIVSPLYPDSYPANVDCVYTIIQKMHTVILLNFSYFDTEKGKSLATCPDYLEVRDGPSEISPLLGKLCGIDNPKPIMSTNNKIWIKYICEEILL